MQSPLRGSLCRPVASIALAATLFSTALPAAAAGDSSSAMIQSIVRQAMTTYHLKAAIVQVRSNGADMYTGAFGESMTGVPASPAMHFRNGAMAFTYMATLLLIFVDQKKTTLDTKLSAYFPNLPNADRITLKNLANMTSGYADYVYQPTLLDGFYGNPFRQWTDDDLIHIGITAPANFEPGTNWGYSHTNYVILAQVLQKIAGMPIAVALEKYVLKPMGLHQTRAYTTAEIPTPVLHSFDSERRETLGIKPGVPFYEESTFWNPSWTTASGAVEITDVTDMSVSMEAVGTGRLLSPTSSAAQIAPNLIGFGHAAPGCSACRANTTAFSYGLGTILTGPWITQTLGFAGASGTVAYLPSRKLTIAVEVTNAASAYDDEGNAQYNLPASNVVVALANALAPNTVPKP